MKWKYWYEPLIMWVLMIPYYYGAFTAPHHWTDDGRLVFSPYLGWAFAILAIYGGIKLIQVSFGTIDQMWSKRNV